MAILDRYLEAMNKQRAQALEFRVGAQVQMETSAGARLSISTRAASEEQLQALLAETLGTKEVAAGDFSYVGPFGAVLIAVQTGPLRVRVTARAPEPELELDDSQWNDRTSPAAPAPAPPPGAPGLKSPQAVEHLEVKPVPDKGPPDNLEELFHEMVDLKASDLHLKSDRAPLVRVDGAMRPLPGRPPLSAARLQELLFEVMPDRNRQQFQEESDTDFAHALGSRARMRCNVFRDIAGIGAVFRQIPQKLLTAKELGLPKAVMDFCQLEKGLVVVTGPTGSGKSTTLAALVDHINETRAEHIITIEDPVEFVHKDKKCLVNQREVGTQTRSFKAALRAALREDPDIVLVGEMRDLETMAIAIETAETGHLVFGTLHTSTAASTVDRLIDQFPADRQQQVRTLLSESLKGVVAQTLLRKKGGGRVAALEVLVVTPAIGNLIREGKTFQIPSIMQTGKAAGMQLLSDSMIELVKQGVVEPQEAFDRAVSKKEFGGLLTRSGFAGPWSEGGAS